MIKAPWTRDQVNSLEAYQSYAYVHPYTSENGNVLIPTENGWVEEENGPVVQDWAHEFSLDWSWNNTVTLKGHEFEQEETGVRSVNGMIWKWRCNKCGEVLWCEPKRILHIPSCEETIMREALE